MICMQFQTACYCLIVRCGHSAAPKHHQHHRHRWHHSPPVALFMRRKARFEEHFGRNSNLKSQRSTLGVYSEMLLGGSKMLAFSAFQNDVTVSRTIRRGSNGQEKYHKKFFLSTEKYFVRRNFKKAKRIYFRRNIFSIRFDKEETNPLIM